jgi:hypothetical protein
MSADTSPDDVEPINPTYDGSSPTIEARKVTLLRRPAGPSPSRQPADTTESIVDSVAAQLDRAAISDEQMLQGKTGGPGEALDPVLVSALGKLHERVFLLKLDEACERFVNDSR